MTPAENVTNKMGNGWIAVKEKVANNPVKGVSIVCLDDGTYRCVGATNDNERVNYAYGNTPAEAFEAWVNYLNDALDSARTTAELSRQHTTYTENWLAQMERAAAKVIDVSPTPPTN